MVDRFAAISADSARVAEIAAEGDDGARVPKCPDWTLRDLVAHLGEVQRFWAANIHAADPTTPWDGTRVDPPAVGSRAEWMAESTSQLLEAIAEAGDDRPCWTWWGEPRTSGAVARQQAQEAAVHRWDAESAVGTPAPIDAEVAHDGVGEYLEIMTDAKPEVPISFRSTDTRGEWITGPVAAPPDLVVSGTASDLVLLLYRRIGLDRVAVDGSHAPVESYLERLDAS